MDKSDICKDRNIILDSIADGVFTVDKDFRITSINKAAEKILGINESEALHKYCFEIFHANICEHNCALKQTIATGKNIINKTIYIVRADGEEIPISITTALLKDENNEIIGGVETFRDISDIEELKKTLESTYSFEDIISKNKKMQDVFSVLPDIAQSDSSVLIYGKSGTGKELIARAIHNVSNRKDMPLVVVNCGAIPESLIESELFGYKAGAFTDAKKDKPGKISQAEKGTLFLDEIGELPKLMQVKLLRFLQEKEYEPLGGTKTIKSDVRIISATNKNLFEEVQEGNFRDDLFYRLNVINIQLPALKERSEDIPLLIQHFIKKFNILKGKSIEGVSDAVMNILYDYSFPGNIRELENIIEHTFVLCNEPYIQLYHLPLQFKQEESHIIAEMTLESIEKLAIERTLSKYNGNKSKTAKTLGIDASTLWRKIKKYNISIS